MTSLRVFHWTFAVFTGFFVVSGFGITHPEIIGPMTGGLLGNAVSFQIHLLLWGPFLVLLVLHIFIATSRHETS